MLVEKIIKKVSEKDFSFDNKPPRTNAISGSAVGNCTREVAYKFHCFEGNELNARSKFVFRLGDHIESDLVQVAAAEGWLTDMQREVSVKIDGYEVKGHIDGITTNDEGNKVLVDFKSINTRGYSEAVKSCDVGKYKYQLTFYMHALGLKKAMILYYNKDTSHLAEVFISYDPTIWGEIEAKIKRVLQSTPSSLPDRDYGPNAKGNLPWQCSYCSYNKHCWPEYVLNFDNAGKPQLKVNK